MHEVSSMKLISHFSVQVERQQFIFHLVVRKLVDDSDAKEANKTRLNYYMIMIIVIKPITN